jgi:hypothetical protein
MTNHDRIEPGAKLGRFPRQSIILQAEGADPDFANGCGCSGRRRRVSRAATALTSS